MVIWEPMETVLSEQGLSEQNYILKIDLILGISVLVTVLTTVLPLFYIMYIIFIISYT